jgi:DNA (cytosine-5)-methyltransferase 1
MRHGSLFSGIGGFDLAADWMGWENIFHCEIAEFPRKILNHYWPNAECHEDIKKTDFTKYRGTVDIISGGFPCQPYSAAGKRLGKEDDRHLWPEMLRVIREVKPQWVVGENVRGLLNWNGGMVFHEVCADLENIGYEVQAFIIPASGINAPHQRERLWIVANSRHSTERKTGSSITNEGEQSSIIHTSEQSRNKSAIFNNGFCDLQWDVADTDNTRTNNGMQSNGERKENDEQRRGQSQSEHWENGINGNVTNSQNYGRKTDERINNGTKYKSNDRGTIRNIFNTDGKQRDVADTDLHGFDECNGNDEINASERGFNALNDIDQISINTERIGRIKKWNDNGQFKETQQEKCGELKFSRTDSTQDRWRKFPTQSPVCGGDDGISHGLDNITFSKWRNESIKGYGNAVVPQVVYRIFKTIEYIQNLNDNTQSKN